MSRLFLIALCAALAFPVGARAQADAQTLADIRQELSVLYVEVQRLTRELSTTGSASVDVGGNTPLERIDAIEQELQRLTSRTEELQYRVERIVTVGSNQIGDLEFRLCELEPGCDISTLGEGSTLGDVDLSEGPALPIENTEGSELAVSEQADFDRAQATLEGGDYSGAADQFQTFLLTYPGGPLSAEAHFLRGEALENTGDIRAAARSYLESFSSAPSGRRAPDALYKVGTSLAALGQAAEACQMFEQVGIRFPDASVAFDAQSARRNLGCS